MPTTMKLIAKQTLGSTTATVTFSSIPSAGYSDLLLLISARTNRSAFGVDGIYFRFNGDNTAGNYTGRRLYGTGSAVASDTTADGLPFANSDPATSNVFGNSETYIPNAFGSTAKSYSVTGVTENNGTPGFAGVAAARWSGTSAISSIAISSETASSFISGSSFFLYGITKA